MNTQTPAPGEKGNSLHDAFKEESIQGMTGGPADGELCSEHRHAG